MKLTEIRNSFLKGEIDKWQYIDKMHTQHDLLFEYAEFIAGTNISSVEITDNRVIMTFRDSGVKFICVRGDKRLAPIDSLNFGSYELEELQMQLSLIDEGMKVFDIGANLGWYALHVASVKRTCMVYSFEPVSATFERLNANIELNRLTNVKIYNFGFSDREGIFSFFLDPSLTVNASMTNVSGSKNIQEVKCEVRTLDEFIKRENLAVDFIKCDVEGAELLAFQGGVNIISTHKPVIFTEMLRKWTAKFNYHPNDIIDFFVGIGYSCFIITGNKLERIQKVTEHTLETNYFFLHEEKHQSQILKHS